MDEFTDKLILIALAFLLLLEQKETGNSVVALLIAVTVAALGIYIEEKKILYLLFAVVFALSLIEPFLFFFFPVFFYDMARQKMYVMGALFLLLFGLNLPETIERIAAWGLAAAISLIFAYKTEKKQYLSNELIRIRDSGVELNLALKEKNRSLLEKQDYEIHLATLSERNRIAREIHDNVGHMVSRLILMTGALLTVEKEGVVHDQLLSMKDTLNQAMDSIRRSVHDLHEDAVDLRQAVDEILEPVRAKYEVRLEYDMSKEVPRKVKYCLIATTKEAVSNIIKHSNGNRITVSMREHPAFYQFSIKDNGTVQKERKGRGIGLQNMKERVDSLGGSFYIHTKTGFEIFLMIPKRYAGSDH